MTAQYDAPFKAAPRPERVLVVGAGTGNDVAAALRANAGQITAVEIDPLILSVGRALHPERPYGDGRRVAAVNEDARAFFHNDRAAYDLIVFGLLDSHTLFSAASSIRLDNFVYTRESLAEARARLAQAGLLALSFGVPREQEWVGLRLYCTLAEVFGHPPQVYQFPSGDILFLIGRTPGAAPRVDDPRLLPRADYACPAGMPVPTDDWPYLYLRERALPLNYAVVLIGILLLSAGLVRRALPDFRQVNGHFFFMGAAFFLLETKSVTEMALLLGSTWVVNASVIAAILLMIVGANALVARRRLRRAGPWYALLAVSLLVNFLAPINQLLGLPPIVRVALASLLLALPLFFAGLIFALTFSRARAVEAALGSNLIGSVLGGLLEYASLVLGIRSLYALALGMYGLSAFFLSRARDAA
jgi:predicted membrane-bound spermidine synthase